MGNATVTARHRAEAVAHHWPHDEDVPDYARQWRDGLAQYTPPGSLRERMLSDVFKTARLIANSERYGRNDEREEIANWLTLCRGDDKLGADVYAGVYRSELEKLP